MLESLVNSQRQEMSRMVSATWGDKRIDNLEKVAVDLKASLESKIDAFQSQLATLEGESQKGIGVVQESLGQKLTALEARVAVNEGKLKGVQANSLGNVVR